MSGLRESAAFPFDSGLVEPRPDRRVGRVVPPRHIADHQSWILAELIRHLEHPRSGALDFTDMGASWVTVREAVLAETLRQNDRGGAEVVARWDQLMRFAALRLEQRSRVRCACAHRRRRTSTCRVRRGDRGGAEGKRRGVGVPGCSPRLEMTARQTRSFHPPHRDRVSKRPLWLDRTSEERSLFVSRAWFRAHAIEVRLVAA